MHLLHLVLNARNLLRKTSCNVFLGLLREWIFNIFPILHLIMGMPPWMLFRIFVIMLQFVTKHGNSLELVLTVVTDSSMLNLTGPQDPALKRIDKFRLRQYFFKIKYSIQYLHVQGKLCLFLRYSSFCIFNHPIIFQIYDVMMSISTWYRVHFSIYLSGFSIWGIWSHVHTKTLEACKKKLIWFDL